MSLESTFSETSYMYPGKKIQDFVTRLPVTRKVGNFEARITDHVFVMTHDDEYDESLARSETRSNIRSTFFLLSHRIPLKADYSEDLDIQLHFDKAHSVLDNQVAEFAAKTGRYPFINRVHRLYWRSDYIDLAFLSTNGFLVDSTKIGMVPYRLNVNGRLLPIWEVPVMFSDGPSDGRLMSSWSVAADIETAFVKGKTPIVASCHPPEIVRSKMLASNYFALVENCERYGYKSLSMSDLYTKYLSRIGE